MKAASNRLKIIIDSREQLPFSFDGLDVETVREKLDAGDYSLVDLPGIAIERKAPGDLLSCMGVGRERFVQELERLQELEYSAVVVECDFPDLLCGMHGGINPKSVAGTLAAWSQRFPGTHWFMMPDRRWAEKWTYKLLDRFHRDTVENKRPFAEEVTAV
jgi:DNA excision repair protein ERCC-4